MRIQFLASVVLTLSASTVAWSQQSQAQQQAPSVIIVSENKCNFTKLTDLNNWFRDNAAPILNDLVKEGKLLSWGVLSHFWGNEWNNVVYYTGRDLGTMNAAITEYAQRLQQRVPNWMQNVGGWCSEHRDNIYGVVMTSTPPPAR